MNLIACCLIACLVLLVNTECISADRRNNRAWNSTSEQVIETTTPSAGGQEKQKQEEEGEGGGETSTEPLRDAMAISYYPSRRERPPKVEGVSGYIYIS